MGIDDRYWMQQAYQQALLAQEQGEIPVGAVLLNAQGELLAMGRNRVETDHDPASHAEVCVIRDAAALIKNHRLLDTTLYVTLEPCPMCAGLIVQARIKRLVFATRDFKTGAAGSVYNLLSGSVLNHRVLVDEGLMENECSQLLSDFFRNRRELSGN